MRYVLSNGTVLAIGNTVRYTGLNECNGYQGLIKDINTYGVTIQWDQGYKLPKQYKHDDEILNFIKLIEGDNVLKEIGSDVKTFVKDNRQVIYTMAFVLLVDHLVFGGAFRDKLKELVNKLIGKVEKQLE